MRGALHQRGFAALLLSLCFALTCFIAGCAADVRPDAWLESVSRAHLAADQAIADGDLDQARRHLAAVLAAPEPATLDEADRRVVFQDVHFRLANISLLAGRPNEALSTADAGLGLGGERDVFTANLHVARGRALEAMGEDVAAAEALYEALRINDELLQERLAPIQPQEVP